MAGSYRHVTDSQGAFTGLDLIDNLGDAYEAIEEMHLMIGWLASRLNPDDPRRAIHEAWREGYLRPRAPGNAARENLAGFDTFWDRNDG
jgi:hypothetical protein